MPARQRGSVRRRGESWSARWYDEHGRRRERGGFETRSAARAWAETRAAEVAALRRGDPVVIRRRELPSLSGLIDEYLAQHVAEANTLRTLAARLRPARDAFGAVRLDRLTVAELRAWRATLPERSAWHYVKALRQVLSYAVAVGLLDSNPARAVPNPEPKRREVVAFASLEQVEAIGSELAAGFRAVPVFAALTGLRPEELFALERRDVDTAAAVVHVRRVFTDGRVKPYGKQARSLRAVPLPARAAEALAAHPARIDTPLLFPALRGGHVDLNNWRRRHWDPAVRAAGLAVCACGHLSGEHERGCAAAGCRCQRFARAAGSPTPYSLRHTFAAFAIAAGVSLFELARFMGTSAEQIDRTYGHLLPDAQERARAALDAFLSCRRMTAATEAAARDTR